MSKHHKTKAPSYRIRSGTNVTVGDWVGIVVDQSGPDVYVTMPGGVAVISRDSIERRGRSYVMTSERSAR